MGLIESARDRVARALADVDECHRQIRSVVDGRDPMDRGIAVAEALLAANRASAALAVAIEQMDEEGANV